MEVVLQTDTNRAPTETAHLLIIKPERLFYFSKLEDFVSVLSLPCNMDEQQNMV